MNCVPSRIQVGGLAPSTLQPDLTLRSSLYRDDPVKMRSFGWALLQDNWCPYKKKAFRLRNTESEHEDRGQGDVPTRHRDCQPTPSNQERGLEQALLLTPRASVLHPCETTRFSSLGHPVCGAGSCGSCRLGNRPLEKGVLCKKVLHTRFSGSSVPESHVRL